MIIMITLLEVAWRVNPWKRNVVVYFAENNDIRQLKTANVKQDSRLRSQKSSPKYQKSLGSRTKEVNNNIMSIYITGNILLSWLSLNLVTIPKNNNSAKTFSEKKCEEQESWSPFGLRDEFSSWRFLFAVQGAYIRFIRYTNVREE